MSTIDDLVRLYKDTFGLEKLVIVSDNVKDYKQSQGRRLIFDDENRMIHSIEVNTDGNNFGKQNMFHFEAFMYDQVQYMGNYGGPTELVIMLNMLQDRGAIDASTRAELIKYFQDQFSFSLGYGENPYTKNPDVNGINDPNYPVDNEGNILTPQTSQSINNIRPLLNQDEKI